MKHLLFLLLFIVTSANATVTNSFTTSRTTGVAPLAVFFDAKATTSTATTEPFHELHYLWDFDDVGAGNWAEGNLNTLDKNVGYGATNAHVFESAGTYTVELTTTDSTGATDVDTVVVTVTAPDTQYATTDTICFSTSGTFTDCPSGATQVTTSSFETIETHVAADRRLLLRVGETFSGGTIFNISNTGPGTISSYGTGANPTMSTTRTGSGTEIIRVDSLAGDWRIHGINFDSTSTTNYMLEVRGDTENLLFMDNTSSINEFGAAVHVHYALIKGAAEDLPDNLFIHDNVFSGLGQYGSQLLWVSANGLSIQGNNLQDTETNSGEHLVRVPHVESGIIAHNYLSEPASPIKGVLTFRSAPVEDTCNFCGNDAQHMIISDNYFFGTSDNVMSFVGEEGPGKTASGSNFIVERNYITQHTGYSGTVLNGMDIRNITGVTVRNNTILMDNWKNGAGRGVQPAAFSYDTWIYNNTCYSSTSNNSSFACVSEANTTSDVGPVEATNNLMYTPSGTSPAVIASNVDNTGSNNIEATTNPFITGTINGPEDFDITAGSEATNTGATVAVYDAYDIESRPIGGSYDVGAYEYGVAVAAPNIEISHAWTSGPVVVTDKQTVVYTSTVVNSGDDFGTYNLTSEAILATGITISASTPATFAYGGEADGTDGAIISPFENGLGEVSGETIQAGATETWITTIEFDVDALTVTNTVGSGQCDTGETAGGLKNLVSTNLVNDNPDNNVACVDVFFSSVDPNPDPINLCEVINVPFYDMPSDYNDTQKQAARDAWDAGTLSPVYYQSQKKCETVD